MMFKFQVTCVKNMIIEIYCSGDKKSDFGNANTLEGIHKKMRIRMRVVVK
jgi:hypothetical protein